MTKAQNKDRLAKIGLLKHLSVKERTELAAQCTFKTYKAHDTVFDENSKDVDVYFVVTGTVRIVTDAPHKRGSDKEVAFADIPAGNYFGELAAIDGKPRSARVVVTKKTELATLSAEKFCQLIETDSLIGMNVVKRLARMIRELDQRVTALSSLNDSERVYNELIRIARPDPRLPDSWVIPSMPKHNEIASWAGTSREVVAQVIGDLARSGIVERKSLSLAITDYGRLKLMAGVH